MADARDGDVLVSFDGKRLLLHGRAGRIVRWLCRDAERINKPEKGEITFHFAGRSLSVQWVEVHEKPQ